MILDDGGDATMLVLRGAQFEKAGVVPPGEDDDSDEYKVFLALIRKRFETDKTKWTKIAEVGPGRHRGDHDRRAAAVPVRRGGRAVVPGHQRQRLGDQVQVRQQVRHPALADRRHQPRHRRADRRQGRSGVRLRRCRQGLRGGVEGSGRAGRGHRDRPDQRTAGADGRLRGQDGRRGHRLGRHRDHRDRQPGHHHPRAHEVDEAPGDPGQHRALRRRDRDGASRARLRRSAGSTSSRRSTSSSSRTATRSSC